LLEKNSQAIEDAIHDLIKVFVSHEDPADVPPDFSIDVRQTLAAAPTAANSNASNLGEEKKESLFEQNCREVIQYFKNRCLEKITFCLKQSLEIIKKRVMSSKNTKDSSIQEAFIILKISQTSKNRHKIISFLRIFEAQNLSLKWLFF